MRKLIAVAVICLLAITATFFNSCKDKKDETKGLTAEDSLKQVVARGEYLAHHVTVCIDCHSKRDVTKFALPVIPGTEGGGAAFAFGKEEGVPGEVTAPNITPFRLKDWTDDEIARAITRGITKSGDTIFPIMPYHSYSRMSKGDVYAIVAYIRTLKPIESTTAARKLELPLSMLGPLPEGNLDQNIMPDPSDKIKYGQYLATSAACSDCHTPLGPQGPDFSKMFSGGFVFDNPAMKVAVSNITPDSATGIGSWTEEMFVTKFKNNAAAAKTTASAGRQNTMMPWEMYGSMKEDDLKAIYAFLRTVKPISNKVEKYPK